MTTKPIFNGTVAVDTTTRLHDEENPRLQEYRCRHCGHMFFRGIVSADYLEVKCFGCKAIQVIHVGQKPFG